MNREQEAAIVRRVLDGDVNAFETLVREYEKNVYNIALRMVNNSEDASDMTQEAFIKAYNSLPNFRGDSKFSVWLYRLTTNICIDFLRSRGRRPTVSLTAADEDEEPQELDVADDRFDPVQSLERAELRRAVQRGLASLPEDYRRILMLRELSGLSYAEIGQVLRLEEGTVKSRLFRARKKLCDFLRKDGNLPDSFPSNNMKGGAKT